MASFASGPSSAAIGGRASTRSTLSSTAPLGSSAASSKFSDLLRGSIPASAHCVIMHKDLKEERRRHVEQTRHLVEGALREVWRAAEQITESKRLVGESRKKAALARWRRRGDQ